MNNRLTFVFIFVTAMVFAQRSTIAVTYGTNVYDRSFLGQVNTLDSFVIGRPTQYIGLSTNGHFILNNKVKFAGHLNLSKYFSPYIDVNDTTIAMLSGSTFGFGYGFDCLNKAENIDFILSIGANIGRMKITKAVNPYNSEKISLSVKNMFISPKASAMLILYMGRTSLSLNAEYGYDVSANGWKRKLIGRNKSSIVVPAYQQSGLGFSVAVGYAL